MPDQSTTPEDSIEQIRADMYAVPEVRAYMNGLVYEDAREFLVLAFKFAKKWALLSDKWEGRRLLIEAKLWLTEANKRADRDIAARRRPKATPDAFKK